MIRRRRPPSLQALGRHGPLVLEIAGVASARRFEEKNVDLLGSDGAMLDSPRDHDHFAWLYPLITISKAHPKLAFEYQK